MFQILDGFSSVIFDNDESTASNRYIDTLVWTYQLFLAKPWLRTEDFIKET